MDNIGGAKLTISIKLNNVKQKDYLDVASNLEEKIIELIESEGHEFIIGWANPIPKEELDLW